jgi:hypothetical protein
MAIVAEIYSHFLFIILSLISVQFPLSLSLLGLFLLGSTRTKTEQLGLHGYLQNSTQKSDKLKATKE